MDVRRNYRVELILLDEQTSAFRFRLFSKTQKEIRDAVVDIGKNGLFYNTSGDTSIYCPPHSIKSIKIILE